MNVRVQQTLTNAWLSRNWVSWALLPLSWAYAGLTRLRAALYRHGVFKTHRLPVPVVVVGNVVVGGAGKTPTTIAIVQHLLAQGHLPGVISRGHGRRKPPPGTHPSDGREAVLEVSALTTAQEVGDEPTLIWQHTGVPVFVGRQRIEAGLALLKHYPATTVVVCDDGLQHLALACTVSIAVFDERGDGNGWLLPAGLLREPWPGSTGRTIDLVLRMVPAENAVNGFDTVKPTTAPMRPLAPPTNRQPIWPATRRLASHALAISGETRPLEQLRETRLVALAGIAKPQAFFDMLGQAGLQPEQCLSFSDHHHFRDFFSSKLLITENRQSLIMTEKDAVKLFPLLRAHQLRHPDQGPTSAWAVPLQIELPPGFWAALDERLSSANGSQTA